jgi:predicted nucleic acid-binding protein
MDKEIIHMAQKIFEKHDVGPRDSIHAASAISNGVGEIISDDPDFDKIKGVKRLGLAKS